MASCLFLRHPDCLSHRQVGHSKDAGPGALCQTSHGSPLPGREQSGLPSGFSLTNCLTLRLDNQPKADVLEDHEAEVSEGDMQPGDPAFSLLSTASQHSQGCRESMGATTSGTH